MNLTMQRNQYIFKSHIANYLKYILFTLLVIGLILLWKLPKDAWLLFIDNTVLITLGPGIASIFLIIILFAGLQLRINEYGIKQCLFSERFTFREIAFGDIHRIEIMRQHRLQRSTLLTPESRFLDIITHQHTKLRIPLVLFAQPDLILTTLQQYILFDQTPIHPHLPAIATSDIGQRVLYMLALAITLAVSSMILSGLLLKSLHFGNEPYWYLLLLIPLLWFPCFSIIKAEHKAYPIPTAIISVAVLALCIYFSMIQLNRYLTEQQSQTATHAFKLVDTDDKHQEWTEAHSLIHLTTEKHQTLYVYKTWGDGFNADLKTGKTYRIPVQKGWLNDVAFSPRSFHEAVLIDK